MALYNEKCEAFKTAAQNAGLIIDKIPVVDDLYMLVAMSKEASSKPKLMLHVSGVHGVEGYAGSDVQNALLNQLDFNDKDGSSDIGYLFIHGYNPYGMKYLRRWNESGVDLGRNHNNIFPEHLENDDEYALVNEFLNPSYPVSDYLSVIHFYWQAVLLVAKYGFAKVQCIVAKGQSRFPKGLFYSGKNLEASGVAFKTYLKEKVFALGNVKCVFLFDIHTGLGPWNHDTLFVPENVQTEAHIQLYGKDRVTLTGVVGNSSYDPQGVLWNLFDEELTKDLDQFHAVTQEFGSYNGVRVLQALRAENAYHWQCKNSGIEVDLNSPEKTHLLEMFYPQDPQWRSIAIERGVDLFKRALQFIS
ncbi:hypothetical protein MP228_006520 [Amoeboaphelidium protococcarum]|nr:hypothetical protein MP228_006520 [Amoeboaphelidium protococcarum]